MSRKMLIYFDLDGTLLDVSERFYRVYTDILKKYHFECLAQDIYWNLRRNHISTSDIITQTCPKEFVAIYYRERNSRFERLDYLRFDRLVDKAEEVLSNIGQSHDLILVTLRDNRQNLYVELENLGIKQFFSQILTASSFGTWESKFRLIKDSHLGKKSNALIIGDTEIDIVAGQQLGIKTCAVSYGIRTKKLLEKARPDFMIDELRELPLIIKDIELSGRQ